MSTPRDILVNTLLGPDSSFQGDLSVHGFVRIDGKLSGSLRSSGKLVVSESARCEASLVARSAVIGGVVKGDVCVLERLSLLDGAVIVGNVFAPMLDAEGDIVIHGDVEVSGRIKAKSGAQGSVEEDMLAFIRKHGSKIRPFGFSNDARRATGTAWQK